MKSGKCPGCLKEKPLVSSHLVSRAIYDYLRTEELHPIVVAGGAVRATSDQLQTELLCQCCESMLNDGGEKWILNKFCTFDRKFRLYDMLKKQAPLFTDADGETFAAATNAEIEVQKITHFALGVFWKASLHPWDVGKITLGPYAEGIRTWLRGETAFPKNVSLNVIFSRPAAAQIIMNPPYQTMKTPCHSYLFHVPGVVFRLNLGKEMPPEQKTLCFHSSVQHFIVVSDTATSKILNANATAFRESKKTKSYKKASEKQRKLTGKPFPGA